MKFLCLGYFEPARMDALPATEVQAIMGECIALMPGFLGAGHVLVDAGLELETRRVRRADGGVRVEEGPVIDDRRRIGSISILEAADIEAATRLAQLHPSIQVAAGEALGWTQEIRPIHSFQQTAG